MQAEIKNEKNEEENINLRIFKAILNNKPTRETLKEISEYLDQGADIDATDVNNNTPLHVAALTGNLKLFEFLLNRGANYHIPNNKNHTITDIIEFSDTPNRKELSIAFYNKFGYTKRPGTSGLRGDLYETKLLSLILVRALHCTQEFILGTNVKEMGALDDIVLRYKTKDMQKPKIIILQAKHRENEKWSFEYILKLIYEYYQSYIQIRQKILTDKNNILFKDSDNENIECELIIYTSAKEYVTLNKNNKITLLVEERAKEDNSLIKTTNNGRIFKFQYEKSFFDDLIIKFGESRIKTLGKTLAKLILKDKLENFMAEDVMKTYHIFLADNVIQTCRKTRQELFYILLKHVAITIVMCFFPTTLFFVLAPVLQQRFKHIAKAEDVNIGQFRPTFFTSKDKNFVLLKHEICKEIAIREKMTLDHQQTEIENIMTSLTFKLPNKFGNATNLSCNRNEMQPQVRIDNLYSLFQKLFEININRDSKYIYITIDDNSIGTTKLIPRKDVELCYLGGLVGNLLIHDNETDMLKINLNEESLSNDHKLIFQRLKKCYDLSIYRFDINIYGFPKLTLGNRTHDEKLVAEFLNQFKIYTNQSQEDEVEEILKDEIDKLLLKSQLKQHNNLIRDAIYLNIHDKILKWRLNTKSPYLTRFYNFYDEALKETFYNCSQLKNIHENWSKKITNIPIKFENEAVHTLGLERLLDSNKRLMVILSDEISFSSLKIFQYFTERIQQDNYIFINIDSENIDNHLKILNDELEYLITPKCVIISILDDNIEHFYKIISAIEIKKSKIIVIIHDTLKNNLNMDNYIICHTDKNNFSIFSNLVRKMILEERTMIFQGENVVINTILNETTLNLLSPNLLRKIVFNENIVIGRGLTNNLLIETVDYYIGRSLYRCIKLNTNDKYDDLAYFIDSHPESSQETNSMILVSEDEALFQLACTHADTNVHWFINKMTYGAAKKNNYITVWKRSQGTLDTILKYVDRKLKVADDEFTFDPKTLKDIQEKVVIISADSGMGKSTLLTNLAVNTKRLHPNLWIIKINLRDKTVLDQLDFWYEHKIKVDLNEAIQFLYGQISDVKLNEIHKTNLITINDDNEVHVNKLDDQYNTYGIDLSEIEIFNNFYNNNSLAILFDGFDEICPNYTKEVIQLLSTLKTSKVAHLWVTSRPNNILEQLESALGTFAYSLKPLTRPEQGRYLQKVWHKKLELEMHHDSMTLIDEFLSLIKTNVITDFISFPLHLFMFAEIYLNDLIEFIRLKKSSLLKNNSESIKMPTNLIIFYEKFVSKKFDIQFGEENSLLTSKDPIVKNIIENERKNLFEIHKKLSAYYFLNKDILLSNHDMTIVEEYVKNVSSGAKKTGIFEWRSDSKPNFIHKTFADYFGVEIIFDKLRSDNNNTEVWKYFIDSILRNNDIGIRTFINSKLQNDQSILSYLRSNRTHINTVFEILLAQLSKKDISAIYLAIEDDLEHIFTFLIECLKLVLVLNKEKSQGFIENINKTCSRFCIFCLARRTRRESIIKCLKEFIIDTSCYTTLPGMSTLQLTLVLCRTKNEICVSLNSLTRDQETTELIVEFLAEHNSATHWILGKYGYLTSFCFDYLLNIDEKKKLSFFCSDLEKQSSFKYVRKENDDFNVAINRLLGKESIEQILSSEDYGSFRRIFFMLKNVLKEVFSKSHDLTDEDVKDLVYNELTKLRSDDMDLSTPVSRRTFWQYIPYGKQLYQKKLLNLILIRALCDDNIKDFILAKRVTGTFGEIVIKYKTKNHTKMLFLHVMYPNPKKMKANRTLNFERYLRDYLFIRQKFATANKHEILCRGSMKDIDCKFIIYNTVKVKNIVNKVSLIKSSDQEKFLRTDKSNKSWQFDHIDEHINYLVPIIVKIRAIELAKTLSMYIVSKHSPGGIVTDELIRTYHVFLSQKVVQIAYITDDHCIGVFRDEFLKSDEECIMYMRREICERIAYQHQLQFKDAERFILLHSFNLPVQFCQPYFGFYENDVTQQDKIENICSTFKKILQCVSHSDLNSNEYIIDLDDDSVGPGEIIQRTELVGKTGLAGLVGTLLIADDETDMLKFNSNETVLPPFDLSILRNLEQSYNLKRFKFNINVHGFPKLSLNYHRYDKKLAMDFLSKLRFYYTNDTNITKVEKTLKNEIHRNFSYARKHRSIPFRVKCDAIFLNDLKYSIKYPGIYKNTIYNTGDLASYAVPLTRVRSKPRSRARFSSAQNLSEKPGLGPRLQRGNSRP